MPTSAVVDTLLCAVDLLGSMVNDVASSNDVDVSGLCAELVAVIKSDTAPDVQEELDREVDIVLSSGELTFVMMSLKELVPRQRQGCHIYVLKADLIADVQSKGLNPVQFLNQLYALGELVDSYASTMGLGNLSQALPESLILVMLVGSKATPEELSEKLHVPLDGIFHIASPEETEWGHPAKASAPTAPASPPTAPPPTPQASQPPKSADERKPTTTGTAEKQSDSRTASAARQETSLRVNVDVLDKLMNLAGEPVLGRNQLLQMVSYTDARGMDAVAARLDQVTSELQEAIMQTRMQAVGTVFNRFVRIVRDLSTNLGKQCALTIEGKQVELDIGSTLRVTNAQKADGLVINLAGRQRMLTQKFAKEVLEEANRRQELATAKLRGQIASTQITADRRYYTKNVIGKLKKEWKNFKASDNYHEMHATIPLPTTFVREVSESSGAKIAAIEQAFSASDDEIDTAGSAVAKAVSLIQQATRAKDDRAKKNMASAMATSKTTIMTACLMGIALLSAILTVIARSILRPLKQTILLVQDLAEGESHLTKRLDSDRKDEFGQMGRFFNTFMEKLQVTVRTIVTGSDALAESSSLLLGTATQLKDGADETTCQSTAVSAAAEEMQPT